jgi:hypothetical protein
VASNYLLGKSVGQLFPIPLLVWVLVFAVLGTELHASSTLPLELKPPVPLPACMKIYKDIAL